MFNCGALIKRALRSTVDRLHGMQEAGGSNPSESIPSHFDVFWLFLGLSIRI